MEDCRHRGGVFQRDGFFHPAPFFSVLDYERAAESTTGFHLIASQTMSRVHAISRTAKKRWKASCTRATARRTPSW
jgi:hypothetical protein